MKPRLLDLFCGAGGAAMGYQRAGFDVVGVDNRPQPHYPFEFIQADALEFVREHGAGFDAIHASPPCQAYTIMRNVNRAQGRVKRQHPMLIGETRTALEATGKPWVIENVQGAPLQTQVIMCGHSLGLTKLARHRHFESNIILFCPPCTHRRVAGLIGVYGQKPDGRRVGPTNKAYLSTWAASSIAEASAAMGIDWMTWEELREAIPPSYTEYIGRQLMEACR